MPRNVNGVYTLPSGNPVIGGTIITAEWGNTTMDDIATALTDSLDRDGRGTMRVPLLAVDGLANAPGFAFQSEPSTGFWRESAGIMNVSVQGSKIGTWTATGLAVTAAVGAIRVANKPETNAGRLFVDGSVVGLESRYATSLTFGTDATERMRISADGNLGLGVTPNGTGGAWRSFQMSGGSGLTAGYGEVDVLNQAYAGGVGTFNYFADAAPAARYTQSQGIHLWYSAAAGTQAATIAWTDLMQIGPDKNLQVQGSVLAYGGVVAAVRNTGYGSSPGTELRCGSTNEGDVNNGETYRWDWRVTGDSNGFAYTLLRTRRAAAEVGVLQVDRRGKFSYAPDEGAIGLVEVGFRDVVRQDIISGWVVAPEHRGRALMASTSAPNCVVYIDGTNGMPSGSAVTLVNMSGTPMTIVQSTGMTLRWSGQNAIGDRTLATFSAATVWYSWSGEALISGSGLS